ncbi:alpha/beta hydrolase [Polymorphobacter glacialis]|uniref:Alpha/beta hydrolase n=1 Tax=Sandarakinorhabdus glacialis TaxID=1614636 RepID=A0A916ZZA5_9SPHN|nr:alpha/beta hydrolase [Polymorphobacter glacialis]GGE19965.1 alpha/beta hydrolase [Polymorphobacter glacialis]
MNRRHLLLAALAAPAAAQTPPPSGKTVAGLPAPLETLDLWPKGAPGGPKSMPTEIVTERSTDAQLTDRAVGGISRPRLVVFRPLRPNGAAMLITPGGGYKWVVVDREGYELGRWLAARGVTAFILFYRLPGDGWAAGPDVALSDAQRAIRLIRHRAADYGVDPQRVGALGFSAGGHVCADLGARFATATYKPVDAADRLSPRPLLAAPIYPVVSMSLPVAHPGSRQLLIGGDTALEAAHSPHLNVPANAPPHFLVHAEDDNVVPVENSLLLRAALRARGIPVETHLFTHGGHGFGLNKAMGKPAAAWPDLFMAWAATMGLV